MRKSTYLAILIIMGLNSCVSQKKIQTKPPFIIEAPVFYKWNGSKEVSGSGLEVRLPIRGSLEPNIELQQLYFRGSVAEVIFQTINESSYAIAKFTTERVQKPDIVMHSDPKKEVGNQAPKIPMNTAMEFPFELTANEAVLSYTEKDGKKVKYTKVSGIKEKPAVIYSSKAMN